MSQLPARRWIGALVAGAVACSPFGTTETPAPIEAGATPSAEAGATPSAEAGAGCNGRLDCERTVFVTRETFSGYFGGVLGADAKCQAAADASPLPNVHGRQYRAWLSDPSTTAKARMSPGTAAYRRPDGALIEKDWKSLLDGSLQAPINVDEYGGIPPTCEVWTGSFGDGSFAGYHCTRWQQTVATPQTGNTGSCGKTGSDWTDNLLLDCAGTAAHLYCFEL